MEYPQFRYTKQMQQGEQERLCACVHNEFSFLFFFLFKIYISVLEWFRKIKIKFFKSNGREKKKKFARFFLQIGGEFESR